jgi:hypothetical protein
MISKPAPLSLGNDTLRAVAQAVRVAALLAVLAFLLAILPI